MRDVERAEVGDVCLAWTLRALLCILAAVSFPAFATNYTVTNTIDTNDGVCDSDCSLREAIVAANTQSGPDRVILGSNLAYTLSLGPADAAGALVGGSGDLDITDALIIDGNGSSIDAAAIDRVLDIQGNFTVTLNNVTIKNGSAKGFLSVGGGVNIRAATVVLNSCTITNNSTTVESGSRDNGGGIAVLGSYGAATATTSLASLTLNGTTVSANTGANGGGILCALCALTISNSAISANTAEGGDGGGIDLVGNSSTLSMTGSTLMNNSVSGGAARGGGLSVPFGASVSTLNFNRIVNNTGTLGSAIFNNVGSVSGDNNWWGCNYGPGIGGAGCTGTPNGVSGPFTMSRYLVLKVSSSAPTLPLGATATITADLTFNSLNVSTLSGGNVPNGIPAAFSGTRGTFATPSSPTTNGKATNDYTATGPKGAGTISATVDGQIESITVNVGYESFTDDPLIAGITVIRAVHVTELRTRINAVRAQHALAPYSYLTPSLAAGSIIQAQHITDLRTALAQAYVAAGLTAPTYTDSSLAAGATIKVAHIAEIRAALIAIE